LPISIGWVDDNRTAIREVFTGIIDIDELDGAFDRTLELINSVDHPVDVLLIFGQAELPGGILARFPRIAGHHEYWNHRHLRRVFVVGANSLIRVVMKIYMQIYPAQGSRFVVADTEAEAYLIIKDTVAS
jgi:hypothetical protein